MKNNYYRKNILIFFLLIICFFSCNNKSNENNSQLHNTNLLFSITNAINKKEFHIKLEFICKINRIEKAFNYSINTKNTELYLPELDDKSSCSIVIDELYESENIQYKRKRMNKENKKIIYKYIQKKVSFTGSIILKINNNTLFSFSIIPNVYNNRKNLTFILRKIETQEINNFTGINLERISNSHALLFIDNNIPKKIELDIIKKENTSHFFKILSKKEVPIEISEKTNKPYCSNTATVSCYYLIENNNDSVNSETTFYLKIDNEQSVIAIHKNIEEYFISENDNLFCYGIIKKVQNNVSCLNLNSSLFDEIKVNKNAKIMLDRNNTLYLLINERIFQYQQKQNGWAEISDRDIKQNLKLLTWLEFSPVNMISDKLLLNKLTKLFFGNQNEANIYQTFNNWKLEKSYNEIKVYSDKFNTSLQISPEYQETMSIQSIILLSSHFKEFKLYNSFIRYEGLENHYYYDIISSKPALKNEKNSNLPVFLRTSFSCYGSYNIPTNSNRFCNFFEENSETKHTILNIFFNYEDNHEFIDFLNLSKLPLKKEFELFLFTTNNYKYYLVGKINFTLTFSLKNNELHITPLSPADLHLKKCSIVPLEISNSSKPGLNIDLQCQ